MQEIVAKMQNPLQRIALVALGWILTLVGIVGLFLPVVLGAFLIVAGGPDAESSKCVAAASAREMSSEVSRPRACV
jgi:hypothetical protein